MQTASLSVSLTSIFASILFLRVFRDNTVSFTLDQRNDSTDCSLERIRVRSEERDEMMNSQTVSDTLSEHEDIHVEIEHVAEETGGLDSDDGLDTSPTSNATHLQGKLHLYTRVQGKRTVILPHQRKILEEFYRTGMVSASHNLHHLHEAAADQTGLELYVIKVTIISMYNYWTINSSI